MSCLICFLHYSLFSTYIYQIQIIKEYLYVKKGQKRLEDLAMHGCQFINPLFLLNYDVIKRLAFPHQLSLLKVSKSQKQFFLNLHCPKNERILDKILPFEARSEFCLIFCSFFRQWSFKKKSFEIYWPLGRHQKKVSMLTPEVHKIGQA